MADTKFSCPHCGQHIEAGESMAGMTALCPTCNGELIVPHGQPDVSPKIWLQPPLMATPINAGSGLPAGLPPILPPQLQNRPCRSADAEKVARWGVARRVVEQRIREEVGDSEELVALVRARKGSVTRVAVAITIMGLLFPLTLPLLILLIIPGFIWIVRLAARDYKRDVAAGGNGTMVILGVVLYFLIPIASGFLGLMNWVVCPLFGIEHVYIVRTRRSIVLLRFRVSVSFSSVVVLPAGDVGIDLLPRRSPQPKMVLSGVPSYHELQVVMCGRDERDQLRDLQLLAAGEKPSRMGREPSIGNPEQYGTEQPPPPMSVLPVIIDTKKCPLCAEFIEQDALVCKHCGHHFSEEEVDRVRQRHAAQEEERAAAAEVERQRAILEAERAAVTLRREKAKFRRVVAWVLISTAVLLNMLAVLGAVAGAKTGHPILEGLTTLGSGVLILFIPLGLPAVLLLRSARRLSRTMETSVNVEPGAAPKGGPTAPTGNSGVTGEPPSVI